MRQETRENQGPALRDVEARTKRSSCPFADLCSPDLLIFGKRRKQELTLGLTLTPERLQIFLFLQLLG